VKTTIIAVLGLLLLVSPAAAYEDHGRGFGLFGGLGGLDFGGLALGEHHGRFGGLGFLGGDFGFGSLSSTFVDRLQTRFENQFDTLKTQYDNGVAGSTDFFNSSQYDMIVNRTQRLDDRYGLFVDAVQNSIDRIPDLISNTNDDITFFNNLLADYQADTSISPAKLDRIELVINHITDRLNSRVDSLTSTQTTLQTKLPTYQSFQTDISTFLSDIQTAGGTTSGTTSGLMANGSSMFVKGALSADTVSSASSGALSPTEVPEPATAVLGLIASAGVLLLGAQRARPADRSVPLLPR
jgi:hypothetical protein